MMSGKEQEIWTQMDKGWNLYASTSLVPRKQVIFFHFLMHKMETVIFIAVDTY